MQIIKLLCEKPRTIEEICCALDMENKGVQKETITKYFSTLREFGCIIKKEKTKFVLKEFPCFIQLNKEDIDTLKLLSSFSKELLSKNQNNKIANIISKIIDKSNNKYISETDKNFIKENIWGKYKEKIEIISDLMQENNIKVEITYKEEKITSKILNFKYRKNKIYLLVFDEKKLINRLLLIDNINNIKALSRSALNVNFAKTTVFKLKGRIAKGYVSPYKDEKITYLENGDIIVENQHTDKNILMKRLIKYFDMCEILSPKNERIEFKNNIDNLIKKYSP